MKMYRYRHLFYCFLGSCLILLFAACGSNTSTGSGITVNPSPTPKSIVTATTVPTQAPKLTITFGCKTGIKEGFYADQSHAFACVHTLPGASLAISVSYCNGSVDQSSALKGTFTADSTGYYEWRWAPQATCTGGPAYWSGTATVTAQLNGQTASSGSHFQAN